MSLGSQKPEIGVRSHRSGSQMHQVLVGNVAVGKHHSVNLVFGDQIFQIVLFENRNAFGIQRSGKFRRITATGNVRNLSGSECDYVVVGNCHEIGR